MASVEELFQTIEQLKQEKKDEGPTFEMPLDIAIVDKKSYNKPEHLLTLQDGLVNAWELKESLACSLPSRFGKTETISYFIAWLLMKHPRLKIMWCGYNIRVSARFVRNINRILRLNAPEILDMQKQTQEYFETLAGGYMLATAPGSSATSFGANIIVIDDLIKNDLEALSSLIQENHESFWDSTLSTRMEPFTLEDRIQYDPLVFAIGTLWSDMDLLNKFHREFKSLKIPALNDEGESIWKEVWPTDKLLAKREKMSTYFWNSMYMASPIARGGNYFQEDWLQSFDDITLPNIEDRGITGIFVDPAVSKQKGADFTAIGVGWIDNNRKIYFSQLYLHHKSVFENIEFIADLYSKVKPSKLVIENVGFADALIEGLRVKSIPATGYKPGKSNKEARIISQLEAPLETGMIYFDRSILNNPEFKHEYAHFPRSAHDDALDMLAIGVEILKKYSGTSNYTKLRRRYNPREEIAKTLGELGRGSYDSRSDNHRRLYSGR